MILLQAYLEIHALSRGLQIAQSRPYLYTLGPKVGIIYIHGAPWCGLARHIDSIPGDKSHLLAGATFSSW